MIRLQDWRIERAAGLVFVVSSLAALPGLMMFWFRDGQSGGQPPTSAYFVWERSFILAAVAITAIGFALLAGALHHSSGRILAIVGATAYLFGGVLLVSAETLQMTPGFDKLYGLVVIYVVTAFLAQAAIGGALLQSRLVAAWIGWATIVWNIAWLIALPALSPRDIYFPILHHVMPLVIGIALLRLRRVP
jgi:hypothetical protein